MRSLPIWRGLVAALVLASLAVTAPPATGRADAASGDDVLGGELMRLVNLDRSALALSALTQDPLLASLARDRSFACPVRPGLVVVGRALDMAERAYFSHDIDGCTNPDGTSVTMIDVLGNGFGYEGYRGEIIGWNTFPTASTVYMPGCDESGLACAGSATQTPQTVAVVEAAFMRDLSHRGIIVGRYDRFGCGSAQVGSGPIYYACLFALGAPAAPPRIDGLTGVGSSYVARVAARFSAHLADDTGLAYAQASIDGHLAGVWTYRAGRFSRISIVVASSRMSRGRHLIVWKVRNTGGLWHVEKVTFSVR